MIDTIIIMIRTFIYDADKQLMIENTGADSYDSKTVTDSELDSILNKVNGKYYKWPDDLIKLHAAHNDMKLGGIFNENNKQHQMITFLINHKNICLNRNQILKVYQKIFKTEKYNDVIQHVNKCDQYGLKRIIFPLKGANTVYGFPVLIYDGSKLYKRAEKLDDNIIVHKTAYIRDIGKHILNDNLEKGHKNPNKPLTDDNLVMQPHIINAAYRDKYIFDDNGLPSLPNPSELIKNPDYYSKNDDDLLAALTIALNKVCSDKNIDIDDENLINRLKQEGYKIK